MQYAKLNAVTPSLIDRIVDLTTEQYQALNGNPKQAYLRPLVVDAQPTPTTAQVVVSAGYVVEPTQVRQTWALRDKTAAELDAEARATLLDDAKVDAVFTALKSATAAQIATYIDNQFGALTAAQRNVLKMLCKAVALLLRERTA